MAFNPYGAPPYGPPPTYGSFPGASHPPGMAPPPGLGPPPGMSSAPGMAPPGVPQLHAPTQANRPSGLPSFQPPTTIPNIPNINMNAAVIRLGSIAPPTKPGMPLTGDRRDSHAAGGNRPGLGADRGLEHSRAQMRENMQSLVPPTSEERLRTIFVHKLPSGVGGDEGVQKLLKTVGKVRRWDSALSHLSDDNGKLFGFAQYEDAESLAVAVELLRDIQVPVQKQDPVETAPQAEEGADPFENIDKVKLKVEVDPSTLSFLKARQEERGEEPAFTLRVEEAREALNQAIKDLFFPPVQAKKDGDGDIAMSDGNAHMSGENVEVVNIPLAQEDELADVPPEMRETVAAEIAAFRERSKRRDMEQLRREAQFEEMERQRSGAPRVNRLGSPQPANSNAIPLGPRGMHGAPSGPRGSRNVEFVNGGTTNGHTLIKEEDDTDADDEELHERELAKKRAEDDRLYRDAEQKWLNRERQRTLALGREQKRERDEAEKFAHRREEQLKREKNWDDEQEATQKRHPYYRDRANWVKERTADRDDEAMRDEMDRSAEHDERRKAEAEMEQARGMADSFLERQAEEMERRQAPTEPAAAPQRFTISFGAAAQRAQARAAPARRTIAEVEGLLDDEEQEQTTKRQLVPIKFEPITDTKAMSEEDMQNAVRALAQEIPADREGLWAWDVKWDYLEESIIREKLRPFVEKKVVEYLGVQEQFLVDVVEGHLAKHGKPGDLVETLGEALDEDAEDLVKKLWRMVIFFTESEKRGLPA